MTRTARYAAILLASILPHLKGITSPVLDYHYHRQANTAAIARNYHADGLHLLHPRISWDGHNHDRASTEFPLYMWLVGLFWNLFGLGDLWGRILSAAFSALTAVVLFRLLEDWIGTDRAFWGAVFFGILPVEIYFGRTVQPEALALLTTAISFYALSRYLNNTVTPAKAGVQRSWWLLSVLAAALAIGHKLPYAYLLGACAAMIFYRLGKKAFSNPWLWAYPAVVGVLVLAWYKYAATAPNYVVPTDRGRFLEQLDYSHLAYFIYYQTFARFPELTTTWPGVLFFLAGARELLVRKKMWFFGAWWLCVWAYVCFGGGYAFQHEYAALPFALVNPAFMGAGFCKLKEAAQKAASGRRTIRTAALALIALAMPLNAGFRIWHWYRLNYPFLLTIQPVIDRISAPDDLFLCNQRANSLYLYFINREGWSWSLQERGVEHLKDAEEARAKGAKFFLTEKNDVFAGLKNPISDYFKERYPVVFEDNAVLILRLSGR